jgi:hypothetical protein
VLRAAFCQRADGPGADAPDGFAMSGHCHWCCGDVGERDIIFCRFCGHELMDGTGPPAAPVADNSTGPSVRMEASDDHDAQRTIAQVAPFM